jgi:GntR family transcriptional regulator
VKLGTNGAGMPAYQRIQAVIRQRIERGDLQPGDALDSERSLAKLHKVSLMTARHALIELHREGLVERRRGSGTFVATPKIQFNKLMSFTEQMAGRNLKPHSQVLSSRIIRDEHDIAARLALPPGSPLLVIERLRAAAGEPFALETCYLSSTQFRGLVDAGLDRGSLFTILKRDYGIEVAYAEEAIDATVADQRTAKLLHLLRNAPLLRIRQLIFSNNGKPITYVLGSYRSDRHVVMIRRTR